MGETDFLKVNWGSDDAKGDNSLSSYFIRIPEFDKIKEGDKRYIIGRKGTGKTAIIEQVTNEIKDTYDNFYSTLSLKDFPIQSIRNLKDSSLREKSQFVPIWTFLIYNEIARLVIRDQSATPGEDVVDLRNYLKLNFPEEVGFVETIKRLESNQNKVSIIPKWFGLENASSSGVETVSSIHFQRATNLLKEKIKKIKTNSTFYLFLDELDEGYKAGDKNLRLILLALLRAVENTFIDLKNELKYRPVVALRSDIFDNLEDNDLNKLDDFLIRLKWTTESKSPYSLYDLVNARINASIVVENPSKAWECITENHDPKLPEKIDSLWSFIFNRTFERPRDIVKFLKHCSKQNLPGKLRFETASKAEIDYSDWFYNELRDEIQSHLSIWREATECIIKHRKSYFTLDEIKPEFEADSTISKYLENNKKKVEDILKYLYDFGVIGTISSQSKKWHFKYKDHNLAFNPKLNMIVHFGFSRKFRMKAY